MITKMLAAQLRTHDMFRTIELHPELQANDLLVADRAFCSFSHLALRLQAASPGDDLSPLIVNPDRPNRLEPRVRKRSPKKYKLMNKPRKQLKKELNS